MASADFAALGVDEVAFVKVVTVEGRKAAAVHAADGTALAICPSRDLAFAMIRQNDMEPVSIH